MKKNPLSRLVKIVLVGLLILIPVVFILAVIFLNVIYFTFFDKQ